MHRCVELNLGRTHGPFEPRTSMEPAAQFCSGSFPNLHDQVAADCSSISIGRRMVPCAYRRRGCSLSAVATLPTVMQSGFQIRRSGACLDLGTVDHKWQGSAQVAAPKLSPPE